MKMTSFVFPRQLLCRDVTDNKIAGSPPSYFKESSSYILETVRRGDDIIASSDSYRDVPDNKTTDNNLPPFNLKDSLPPALRTMCESLCREEERLKTFDNWPLTFIDKNVLAQTGMYYLGANDNVKCYFCEVEIGRWETTDNPLTEHIRFSPNCPLLRRRTTNNIPLDPEALDRILPPPSYDVCGRSEIIDVRPAAYAESSNLSTSTTSSSFVYPDHPEYAIESARLRSFSEWPRTMKQKPAQLSEAGFFYTGIGDRVKCFSCGGGLKDWDESDDPWEQHALWLTNCPYVKLIKGKSFIDSVIAKYKTPGATECKENGSGSTEILDVQLQRTTSVGVGDETGINTYRSENDDRKVSEDKLCKICYGAEYDTAFLPCGHVVACAKCASSVTKCPLCRKPFTNVIRVYFS